MKKFITNYDSKEYVACLALKDIMDIMEKYGNKKNLEKKKKLIKSYNKKKL